MSCQSSLHLDSRRHHGLLLCAGGRLLSRDHDVPVLDASTVGDSEQGMEDKGLTSERAFGAQVREATLGDDLSNAVVRHGDSLLGEGGECRNQTNHAVGEARRCAARTFPCQVVIECRGVAVDKNALHRAVGDPAGLSGVRVVVDGRVPSICVWPLAVSGTHGSSSAQCWTTLWFSIRHRSNRTAVGPSSSVISEWLTTYSPSSSRLPARATRRDCSRDGPVRDAALIVPAGDSDGIKPCDRRR